MFHPLPAATGPAEPLRLIMQGVLGVLARKGLHNPVVAPIFQLLLNRIVRAVQRFSALAERARAGTLRPRPQPSPDDPNAGPKPRRPWPALPKFPRGAAWLTRQLPELIGFAEQFRHLLLTDPEMQALLARAPQAKRLLRPLSTMLVAPPVPDPLKPKPRPPRPKQPPKPRERRPTLKERRAELRELFPGYRLPVPPKWDVLGYVPPKSKRRSTPPATPPPAPASPWPYPPILRNLKEI